MAENPVIDLLETLVELIAVQSQQLGQIEEKLEQLVQAQVVDGRPSRP
ncbi:hypothetical protein [Aurantimonas manganoxydans]|nr:hypothetical protein [Aurantimonas manganoxydans]